MRLRERFAFAILLLLALAALVHGWKVFWFLTDDAFIAFRYVSNSRLGLGYVWNAPPFLPVEGYTSFLWVVLLDGLWRVLDVDPTQSANVISFVFSFGTLALAAGMTLRIDWSERLRPFRLVFVALLLVYLTLNRTFLAWSSSGLETAMFCFLVTLWTWMMCSSGALGWIHLVAALIALERPDGLLFCAATVGRTLLLALGSRRKLACLTPQIIVIAHVLWRHAFYGEWLPNTYYAKFTGCWPESGLRYLLSFSLEYGVWFAAVIILAAGLSVWCRLLGGRSPDNRHRTPDLLGPLTATVTLLAEAAYYTFMIGGDHFEYRVYCYAVPLIFVALAWAVNRLAWRPTPSLAVVSLFVALSMPVQWTHWFLTKDLATRDETHVMRVPIAQAWPAAVRWYAQAFDDAQSWLIEHHVCMRHTEHKVFWLTQTREYPPREVGADIAAAEYPVHATFVAGVPGWTLPHVNIIDMYGLNDRVIARTPAPPERQLMAHSRWPPVDYVLAFRPNVEVAGGNAVVTKREPPLTADDIVAVERKWRNP